MAGVSSDPLARPLGRIERFYWLFERQSCTNFVLTAELDASVSRRALEEALARSWQRHPRLRCRIAVDSTGRVVLEPEAAPAPELAALDSDDGSWRPHADAELIRPFPPGSAPLVRCGWLETEQGATAIFTFNHGLLDAGAAAAWLMELLGDACGHPPSAPFPAEAAPSGALYPARYRGLRGLLRLVRVIFREILGRRLMGTPRPLPGAPSWGTRRRPCTLHLDLDPRQGTALVQRCRELGCTVQGALGAAQMVALRAEHPGREPLPLVVASAMDLRPWLEPPLAPGTLGNHVSLLSSACKLTVPADLPAIASDFTQQLRDKRDSGLGHLFWRVIPPAWMLPADARSTPRLEAIARRAPPTTVVTNLGRLPDPPPGVSRALRALRFTMAPQEGSPLCTGAATVNGALRLDLYFDASHLDEDARQRVTKRFEEALAAL